MKAALAVDVPRIFAALANSERLAIIDALLQLDPTDSGSSISEISRATDLSRFSSSRHLSILRAAGIVTAERDRSGFRHHVRLDALVAIDGWAYARALRQASSAPRSGPCR